MRGSPQQSIASVNQAQTLSAKNELRKRQAAEIVEAVGTDRFDDLVRKYPITKNTVKELETIRATTKWLSLMISQVQECTGAWYEKTWKS